jgi:hypothetical protein
MVHGGEYTEPLSYIAGSEDNFRVATGVSPLEIEPAGLFESDLPNAQKLDCRFMVLYTSF